ncbi:hypothetical protein CAPTEDRAFT_217564 [Capitella teleta]|uniref:SOCS box domain-containing protein n=1 Tax=Capitella teleta TaxID=283909 RepID=R7TBP6_CAPTE|nr:hypothetical protein CAPTEDRAFT_217564 [Capitella teleta]|eukprot:ELT91153.1 hypothetical protein CAPTEDRAFT_217564 [Capitella teleta]
MASRHAARAEQRMLKMKSLDDLSDDLNNSDIAISQRTTDAIQVIKMEIRRSSLHKGSCESLAQSASSGSLSAQTSDSGLSSETGICPVKSALSKVPSKDWPILYWKRVGSGNYSLVQEVILRDKPAVLRAILQLCSVNLNYVKCTQESSIEYPLHLACRCGSAEVISVLLDHGANLSKQSCVSEPCGYGTLKDAPSFHFPHYKLTPLWHALIEDQVPALETLLSHRRSSYEIRPIDALKDACSASAVKCVKWMLDRAGSSSDFTAALLFRRNVVDLLTTLISLTTSPDILQMLRTNQQLMGFLPAHVTDAELLPDQLYRIYSNSRAINLHSATEFFLSYLKARASKEHLDRVLQYRAPDGSTVLHMLCQRHHHLVSQLLHYEIAFDGGLLAAAGRKHLLKDHCACLSTLLRLGADVTAVTCTGLSALDTLFPAPRSPHRQTVDAFPRLDLLDEVTLDFIIAVLRQFFMKDGKACSQRPLLLLHACGAAGSTFSYQRHFNEPNIERVVIIFEILLNHGLNPNHKDREGRTALIYIIHSVWYGGVQGTFDPCYLKAFNQILACFIEHGLDILDVLPNVNRYYLGGATVDGVPKLKSATYLCELVGMLRDTFPPGYSDLGNADRKQLHNQLALLIHTFFRFGCQNILVQELLQDRFLPGANVEYACSSVLEELLYLYLGGYSGAVSKFNEQYMQVLLHMLSCVPQVHRPLLLLAIEEKLEAFDASVWNGLTFWRERVGVVLKDAFCRPSSLKQLSRLALLQALDWRVLDRVAHLPLPPQLLQFVQFGTDWLLITNQLLGRKETDL